MTHPTKTYTVHTRRNGIGGADAIRSETAEAAVEETRRANARYAAWQSRTARV